MAAVCPFRVPIAPELMLPLTLKSMPMAGVHRPARFRLRLDRGCEQTQNPDHHTHTKTTLTHAHEHLS